MKQTPLIFKLVINFVAYIGYTFLLSVIFSFSFPLVLNMLGKELYNPADPIFMKIQISIALIVLIFTVIFRKYFYMSLSNNCMTSESYDDVEETKKENWKTDMVEKEIKKEDWLNFDNKIENTEPETVIKKEEEYVFKMDDEEDEEDSIKIFTDKEIKR